MEEKHDYLFKLNVQPHTLKKYSNGKISELKEKIIPNIIFNSYSDLFSNPSMSNDELVFNMIQDYEEIVNSNDYKELIKITDEIAKECVVDNKIMFDKDGDSHYDNISAFIKSMRGSDPDATVFYLARAIYAGEDPIFLARRICILAAEDIGMADPMALVVANSALQVVKAIGMPEGRIVLSEAAVYMANAPKSNASYNAINSAISDVENVDTGIIPMHIRNAPVKGMEKEGYHVGYKYPHDYKNHLVDQQYLPDKIKDNKYYIPDENCIRSFKDNLENKTTQDN